MAMSLIMPTESGVFTIHISTILSIGTVGITILIIVTVMDLRGHFHGIWVGVTHTMGGVTLVTDGDILVTDGDTMVTDGDILIIAGEVVIIPVGEVDIIPVILHIQFTRAVALEIIHTGKEDRRVQLLQETMEEGQHQVWLPVVLQEEIKVPMKQFQINPEDQLPVPEFVMLLTETIQGQKQHRLTMF